MNAKLSKYDLPLLSSDKDKIKKVYQERLDHLLMQIAAKAANAMNVIKEVYHITNEKQTTKETTKKEIS